MPVAQSKPKSSKWSWSGIKRVLVGNPLSNLEAEHQKLPKWKALPVFSSDALSSVAYATEEILLILIGISTAAAVWSLPIAAIILTLLIIVSVSYRQTISLYPNGGGAYQVARDNLGVTSGLTAGAALLVDYILTVAVSTSAGVAAISSAFPWAAQHSVFIAGLFILAITLANLRGMRESSFIFSIPTYLFIIVMVGLLGMGFYKVFTGQFHSDVNLMNETYPSVGLFVLLRAFASGCAALTGIEAISNGVPSFRKPSAENAKKTMTLMVLLLGIFFVGITALAHLHLTIPKENETVLSQIARIVFGDGFLYYVMQIATALILLLAANTAYADFPRLASLMAADRYLPRQLSNIGDRLVFSNGIIVLGFSAFALIFLFNAETHSLIPLYSVGVFISFTLSQFGMVALHKRIKEAHWKKSLAINLVGGVATSIVMIIVAVTKFSHGAWMTVVIIPLMITGFRKIKRHYIKVAKQMSLRDDWSLAPAVSGVVVIPISGLHTGVLKAIQYARGLSTDIRVVTVDVNPISTKNMLDTWNRHIGQEPGIKLVVVPTSYRSVIEPLLKYMDQVEAENPTRMMTVVVPEFVTKEWWENFLHNQTAFFLKARLRFTRRRVVVSVNYHLNE